MGYLPENPPLQVNRLKQVHARQHRLRFPEEQHPIIVQREVEPCHNPVLRFGVEIHQSVAAYKQVQPRDRRVLNDVVDAENHAPTQFLREHILVSGRFEILLPQFWRNRLDILGRIHAVPRVRKGFLVNVRGVNLDAVPGLFQRLGQHHGDRIGFLSRRAPDAPAPDLLVRRFSRDQARNHFRREKLPRIGVPKKLGDIDENGVEEMGELLLRDLEIVPVVSKIVYVDRLHPLGDSARQTATLVSREVKPTVLLDEFQKSF